MERILIDTARVGDCYSGACELLPGWVVSHRGNFEEFKAYVVESIKFYIECACKDGEKYPPVFDGDYEIIYKFDVQSLLLYYQGIFSYAALETITGINQKQLSHYAAGRCKPRRQQAQKIATGLNKLAREMLQVTV